MKELEYPFDSAYVLKKRKSIRKELLAESEKSGVKFLEKRIAILGGSTTHDIRDILELFLLNYGIKAEFYESEYDQWWNDAVFGNAELDGFVPDIVFVHTSLRNIRDFPTVRQTEREIDDNLEANFARWKSAWEKISEKFRCPIIQNNFEKPFFRLLGNRDAWDAHGRTNFVSRLNQKFYEYAQESENFFINDIEFLQADYGIGKWSAPEWWHLYKYALCLDAIPAFAFNLANIIKSIYGKNKKALVCDLDNTLWGGIVGDDGADGIEIGQETSAGQVFAEVQSYIKAHKDLGVLLAVNSKNEEENALAGLNRPDSVLKPDDFITIKANWNPKSENFAQIARELNIGADALVFVDDNPAEREIVRLEFKSSAVPEMTAPERYITTLDRSGFFEVTSFSADDLKRNEMYKANAERAKLETAFTDYGEYLRSLEMKAEIKPFAPLYMARIAQLTNKSNQFNLTTLRCTQADIERMAADENCITLYGKLSDKFGDNGVVSVVAGHVSISRFLSLSKGNDRTSGKQGELVLEIDLWLMSCRVLKRGMEDAMMDSLVAECGKRGITKIRGFYYPTAKNKMVKDFFAQFGFAKTAEDADGNATWEREVAGYEARNLAIAVNDGVNGEN